MSTTKSKYPITRSVTIITLSPAAFKEVSEKVGQTFWNTEHIEDRFFPCCEDGDGSRIRLHINLDGVIVSEDRE
jgi:hypothetical protein